MIDSRIIVRELLLLLHALYESPLIHLNPVFLLQLIGLIVQEGLISGHLISDGHQTDFVNCHFNAYGFNCEEQLFGYVQDLLGKVGPLALRLNESLPSVFILLLQDEIVLLEHEKSLFEIFCLW